MTVNEVFNAICYREREDEYELVKDTPVKGGRCQTYRSNKGETLKVYWNGDSMPYKLVLEK